MSMPINPSPLFGFGQQGSVPPDQSAPPADDFAAFFVVSAPLPPADVPLSPSQPKAAEPAVCTDLAIEKNALSRMFSDGVLDNGEAELGTRPLASDTAGDRPAFKPPPSENAAPTPLQTRHFALADGQPVERPGPSVRVVASFKEIAFLPGPTILPTGVSDSPGPLPNTEILERPSLITDRYVNITSAVPNLGNLDESAAGVINAALDGHNFYNSPALIAPVRNSTFPIKLAQISKAGAGVEPKSLSDEEVSVPAAIEAAAETVLPDAEPAASVSVQALSESKHPTISEKHLEIAPTAPAPVKAVASPGRADDEPAKGDGTIEFIEPAREQSREIAVDRELFHQSQPHEHHAPAKATFNAEINPARTEPTPSRENTPHEIVRQVDPAMVELSKNILTADAGQPNTLKLKLNPEQLGSVEITLVRNESGSVSTTIVTESEAASAALGENVMHLRESLERAGVQVEKLQVDVKPSHSSASGQGGNQQQHSPDGRAERYQPASAAGQGGIVENEAESDIRLVNLRA